MLWGLLAVAVPIAIHLLLRRKPQVVDWGASRFLRVVIARQQSRLQLHEWLHLLVRIAIILLIVLGLSDPRSDSSWPLDGTRPPLHRLLILDVSMSMGATRDEVSRLDVAREQILSLISQSRPGDTWQLLLHGTSDFPDRIRIPTDDLDFLREELMRLSPTYQAGQLHGTLQRAVQLTEEFPGGEAVILFFSDFSTGEWKLTGIRALEVQERLRQLSQIGNVAFLKIRTAATAPPPRNLAVTDLRIAPSTDPESTLPQSIEESLRLEAVVESFSAEPVSTILDLFIDTELVNQIPVTFAKPGPQPVRFEVQLAEQLPHLVEVRLPDDALMADNRRQLLLPGRHPVRVLVVEDAPPIPNSLQQTDFIRLALQSDAESISSSAPNQGTVATDRAVATDSAFRPIEFRSTRPNLLQSGDWNTADVLIVCGPARLDSTFVESLRDFIRSGRGVLFTMSEGVDPASYHQRLRQLKPQLLPGLIGERRLIDRVSDLPFRIGEFREDHPILSPFALNPEGGLKTTRISSYIPLQLDPEHATVAILKLDNGDPLVVEASFGTGKIYWVQTAFHPDWGSWVLWPSFVPFLRRAVDDLGDARHRLVEQVIGRELSEHLVNTEWFKLIQARDGRRIGEIEEGRTSLQELFDSMLTTPGLYDFRWRAGGAVVQTVICHPDTRDSDLHGFTVTQLQSSEVLKDLPIAFDRDITGLTAQRMGSLEARRSTVSRWLVLIAGLLLLFDQLTLYRKQLLIGTVLGLLAGLVLIGITLPLTQSSVLPGFLTSNSGRVCLLLLSSLIGGWAMSGMRIPFREQIRRLLNSRRFASRQH